MGVGSWNSVRMEASFADESGSKGEMEDGVGADGMASGSWGANYIDHWDAIASAIPWYVLLRSFQRVGLGGIM